MNWQASFDVIRQHVVRVETPTGAGTGFLAFYNHDRSWCGIATAAHVVRHEEQWQLPICIRAEAAPATEIFVEAGYRKIYLDRDTDSAIILFPKGELQLPDNPLPLMPISEPCGIGAKVGWVGYPSIARDNLCFFSGTVSAKPSPNSYLIDGVSISGLSGGPVFHCSDPTSVQIVGCVLGYLPAAMLGLIRAQDVSHFRAVAAHITSEEKAAAKKRLKRRESKQRELPVSLTSLTDPQPVAHN
jgi:hypothetical protein